MTDPALWLVALPGILIVAYKCFRFMQFVRAYGVNGGPPNERRR